MNMMLNVKQNRLRQLSLPGRRIRKESSIRVDIQDGLHGGLAALPRAELSGTRSPQIGCCRTWAAETWKCPGQALTGGKPFSLSATQMFCRVQKMSSEVDCLVDRSLYFSFRFPGILSFRNFTFGFYDTQWLESFSSGVQNKPLPPPQENISAQQMA